LLAWQYYFVIITLFHLFELAEFTTLHAQLFVLRFTYDAYCILDGKRKAKVCVCLFVLSFISNVSMVNVDVDSNVLALAYVLAFLLPNIGLRVIPAKAFARDYGITGVGLSVCLLPR